MYLIHCGYDVVLRYAEPLTDLCHNCLINSYRESRFIIVSLHEWSYCCTVLDNCLNEWSENEPTTNMG